jgi:hypothetical protein
MSTDRIVNTAQPCHGIYIRDSPTITARRNENVTVRLGLLVNSEEKEVNYSCFHKC